MTRDWSDDWADTDDDRDGNGAGCIAGFALAVVGLLGYITVMLLSR